MSKCRLAIIVELDNREYAISIGERLERENRVHDANDAMVRNEGGLTPDAHIAKQLRKNRDDLAEVLGLALLHEPGRIRDLGYRFLRAIILD